MVPDPASAADPLVHHGNTRARNASEYIRVTEQVVANMGKMTFPVISFCSENDTMCDPDGSKMLIDRSKVSHLTLACLKTAVLVPSIGALELQRMAVSMCGSLQTCSCCLQSKDKTLRHVNHMWHVLVAEDGNEKICAELVQWMNQRYSSKGSA